MITTQFDSNDDYCTGCRNVSHCQQQSFSGLRSSGRSKSTYYDIECFHSRGQHLCKHVRTKENVCIRKEFNSQRTGLGHQYGRRDVMWKHSIRRFSNSLTTIFGGCAKQTLIPKYCNMKYLSVILIINIIQIIRVLFWEKHLSTESRINITNSPHIWWGFAHHVG